MTQHETVLLGYYLCAALGIIIGMVIMAFARVQEEEEEDDIEHFDFWIDD